MKDLQKILDAIRTNEKENALQLEEKINWTLKNRTYDNQDGTVHASIDDVTFWKAHSWIGEALREQYQQQGWAIEHMSDSRGDGYYKFTRVKENIISADKR